jgi:hypothetical protein
MDCACPEGIPNRSSFLYFSIEENGIGFSGRACLKTIFKNLFRMVFIKKQRR